MEIVAFAVTQRSVGFQAPRAELGGVSILSSIPMEVQNSKKPWAASRALYQAHSQGVARVVCDGVDMPADERVWGTI